MMGGNIMPIRSRRGGRPRSRNCLAASQILPRGLPPYDERGRSVRDLTRFLVLAGMVVAAAAADAQYRTLNDSFTVREYASPAEWQRRAAYLREHILASAGLMPTPEK